MKKCSCCGNDILDDLIKCPYCGSRQGKNESDSAAENADKQEPASKETSLDEGIRNIEKNIEKVKESNWFSKLQTPQGLLKLYSAIAGFIYIYFACSCLEYLGYYSAWYKIWGSVMIVVCILNSIVYFLLFFRFKFKNNNWLPYGLIGGAVIKGILHIVRIQWISRYEYWDTSVSEYLPVVWTVIIAVIGLILLKNVDKNEMKEKELEK